MTYGPSGGKTIYVGVNDKSTSLYRSTDGGGTWRAVPGQPTGQLPQHGVASGDGSLYLTYSNTVGPIIEGLGGGTVAPIGDAEFDRLFVLVAPPNGDKTLLQLRY